jgi:hypothetical protein
MTETIKLRAIPGEQVTDHVLGVRIEDEWVEVPYLTTNLENQIKQGTLVRYAEEPVITVEELIPEEIEMSQVTSNSEPEFDGRKRGK